VTYINFTKYPLKKNLKFLNGTEIKSFICMGRHLMPQMILNSLQCFNNIVSDCCLMPTQQFFSYIMTKASKFSMQ